MARTLLPIALTVGLACTSPALAQPGFPQDPLQNTCGKLAAHYAVTFSGGAKTRARLRSVEPEKAALELDMPGGTTTRADVQRRVGNGEARLVTSEGLVGSFDSTATVRVDLKVVDRITLQGTVAEQQADGTWKTSQVTLKRAPAPPRTAEELTEFDPGPSPGQKALFESIPPDYQEFFQYLWADWGPTYYRGRLDKTARVLVIGSDPGPTECLPFVRRCMIGDTGQRVQGLLAKVGLDRSYLIMNAFPYALHPSASNAGKGEEINANPAIVAWRNKIFASAIDKKLQAVVLFGFQARHAWYQWPNRPKVPVFMLPHPSRFDNEPDANMLPSYRSAVRRLRTIVTPDDPALLERHPNYGLEFTEFDFANIPRRDLPKGATIGGQYVETPAWIGADTWTRTKLFPIHNVVKRSGSKAMILSAPDGSKRRIVVTKASTPGGQPTYAWAN